MHATISEVFAQIEKAQTEAEKLQVIQKHNTVPLRIVLQCAYDPNIKFALPEGAPPYKPSEAVEAVNFLNHEAKKLHIYVEGGYPGLKQVKREQLFISLLEACSPADAEVVIDMKDKRGFSKYPSITPQLVLKAYPGLFQYVEPEVKEEPATFSEPVVEEVKVVPEQRKKNAHNMNGNPIFTQEFQCDICGKKGKGPTFKRYHFDKCKFKPAKGAKK